MRKNALLTSTAKNRGKIENKGGEDLYLTKRFIMKTMRNTFIEQLLSNCYATLRLS